MNKYYTEFISQELFKALCDKGYPTKTIAISYTRFESGGGYPEYAQVVPTYAEVLDWLMSKDIHFSIRYVKKYKYFGLIHTKDGKIKNSITYKPLLEILDDLFLSAINELKNDL